MSEVSIKEEDEGAEVSVLIYCRTCEGAWVIASAFGYRPIAKWDNESSEL